MCLWIVVQTDDIQEHVPPHNGTWYYLALPFKHSPGEIPRFLTVVKFGPPSGLENQNRNCKGRKYDALGHSQAQALKSKRYCQVTKYSLTSFPQCNGCLMASWLRKFPAPYTHMPDRQFGHFHLSQRNLIQNIFKLPS